MAIATAVTIGTAVAAGAGVAAAATTAPAATAAPTTRSHAGLRVLRHERASVPAKATVRTVSDGAFSVARTVVSVEGAHHVVFTARNLRTGEEYVLNGTA
jgi:hypothetical protein